MPDCILSRGEKGVDLDGKGGIGKKGKTITRIHCMKNCVYKRKYKQQKD